MANQKMKVVIIGGVAGGATAIARLRRLDENMEITLLEKGEYVSFANCGLPYYIGQVIKERKDLFVSTPKAIMSKYNVDIRVKSEAISIDANKKIVKVKNLSTNEIYDLEYDKLLISTGSTPIKPPVEGFDGKNVFTLWNIPDTDNIYNYIQDNSVKEATVIGGGFIGLEMAENLAHRGIKVNIVEKANQVMAPIDYDMAKLVHNHLVDKGINLIVGNGVQKILHSLNSSTVVLEDGVELNSDLVILSIGIRPNSILAKDAGIQLNQRGGVIVDEYMQTSIKDIYAVGDIVEVVDFNTKGKCMVPLAGPANKQGRIAADNIVFGEKTKYKGTQGTSIAKVFDLSVAATGLNEKQLNAQGKIYGKDYKITIIHPNSHAGYYPNAKMLTLKLIFDLQGKVLGAQIVGYDGVDKRIDVLATAIRLGATVWDLTELELAYAPPYSSAKDPVNFAGYTAANQLDGLVEVERVEYLDNMKPDEVVLDVREEIELMMGKIPGSINIPLPQLRRRLNELDKRKTYIITCAVGLRGYLASRILRLNGFNAKNLMGGYRSFSDYTKELRVNNNYCSDFSDSGISNCAQVQQKLNNNNVIELDVTGLCCPGPIVQVAKAIEKLEIGQVLKVVASDPGFYNDISSWANNTGHILVDKSAENGQFFAIIEKSNGIVKKGDDSCSKVTACDKEKTMIVFSGDLDKAIASFIIANGAAAMGNKVNMFFTFWGLNILRKNEKVKVKKDAISKMFGKMMPRGSKKLGLSKMNMGGMGSKMIRSVIKKQNVYSLEELINQALKAGVKLTACQMSMDVMGIKKEELIDGVQIGGVASMLADNDNSNMNLFI